MVDFGHSCPVGQLITSGIQFSQLTSLFCHGRVKLQKNAPSLPEQCQVHTGTGKGQHGKLHPPILDFCASCQQPQIALRGRRGAGQAGTVSPRDCRAQLNLPALGGVTPEGKSKRRCGPSAVGAYVHCLHCSSQSLLHLIVSKITWFVPSTNFRWGSNSEIRTSCTDHESLERIY